MSHRWPNRIILTSLLACLPLVGGCLAGARPTFTVADVNVREETDAGLVLAFTIDGVNSGDEPLPLRDVRYSLYLDGQKVFSGYRSPEATLRRRGTQQLILPTVIAIDESTPRPTGRVHFRLNGTVTYLTTSPLIEVLFDAGIVRPSVSFSEQGVIDLGSQPGDPASILQPAPNPTDT